MSKRIALVTGAMGGIGSAICQALARDGMAVVANCLPGYAEKRRWLKKQKGEGFAFDSVEGDVSSYDDCVGMAAQIESHYGSIDVLVNNAGITRDQFLAKMEPAQWSAVIETNLNSLYNMTRPVSPGMAERGWGRIINIASVNGIRGQAGQTNYSAAKAGCVGFTKALAQELASKGVTVNAIAPGFIATEMTDAMRPDKRQAMLDTIPMKRAGRPEEIAAAVSFLCSPLAAYITGNTLHVNGGIHMA
ncbi:MAG: acetoacetyl-CoA reductase [Cupriavidus sp.]|nr:acetoacetyl-CoA reductase [Cupriavidus sp.]